MEALRGFAACYVVLHHSLPHDLHYKGLNIGILFRFGQEAVILFFLLSGFVINFSFQNGQDKTFRTFFFKRFSRIYIPLIFIIIFGYVTECIKANTWVDPQINALLLNLLMLQDISALKPNTIVEPYLNNSPLWSLSYEWWFYMVFFPVVTVFKQEESQRFFIYFLAVIASLLYVWHPHFISRLLMYIAIWWVGVHFANLYIAGGSKAIGFKKLALPISCLAMICSVLILKIYSYIVDGHSASIGVHPFLEFRHMVFALFVVVASVLWNKVNWVGFDRIFNPFIFFAPMSYVIYISHYYFITNINFFSFLKNSYIEWIGCFLCLLTFAYSIEVIFYPRLQRIFLKMVMKSDYSSKF